MNVSLPRYPFLVLFTGTLAAVSIIALLLITQLLNAVQTENAILRQQLAIAELRIRSIQNQHEAELILRNHDTEIEEQTD